MRKTAAILASVLLALIFVHAVEAKQAATGSSAWRTWLSSEERMLPLAIAVVKVADDAGLDGLTGIISSDMRDLRANRVAQEKIDIYLASIWIASVNAAMLQRLDPFPNPGYQKIIDEGLNYSGERLNIPDLDACMLLTAQTIIRAQKEERGE